MRTETLKKILTIGAIIVLALIMVGMKWAGPEIDAVPPSPKGDAVASTTSIYSVPVVNTGSVYDAMRAFASTSDSFSFKGTLYDGLGFFVEEIGGQPNEKGFYWTLYVNSTYSSKGASGETVTPGDVVEWKFIKL